MKCDARALPRQLKVLKPVYVIHGDEPLLAQESLDALRAAARKQGFTERDRHDVGKEWDMALRSCDTLSLFADRKILELHALNKPDAAAGKALDAFLKNPPDDILLLIVLPRLDAAAQKAAWFNRCDAVGVTVSCQPLTSREHRDWLVERLGRQRLTVTEDALTWLAGQTEGNLLAADQEVLKLHMLFGEGSIDLAQVQSAVGDSARFTLFDLTDTALAGDAAKTARIFFSLKAEGLAESLILWTLSREIRSLLAFAEGQQQGTPPAQLFQQLGIWAKRQGLVSAALRRLPPATLKRLNNELMEADLAIKGQSPDSAWDILLRLSLDLAGVRLFDAVI
ncbi:DNA polymerase III delta subunit [Fluviicoccus keumensis]|uniref:DNA polymerase III subunit delta n=1 Tax=Fluviicoccus keumensis TaxID=1435465 RepID=A0A4Q7YHP0_9GAMM|nr:DNA polymerase III subunit delta [Fluviicoccus keumensis]RZU37052.1 DNA polymerase III delta subunit [Fluviicoccus keumensis]